MSSEKFIDITHYFPLQNRKTQFSTSSAAARGSSLLIITKHCHALKFKIFLFSSLLDCCLH